VLPLVFAQAGSYEAPSFIVTHADRATGMAPGDVLLDYDGVPSEALLEHFRFELNGGQVGVRLDQLSALLQGRYGFAQLGLAGTGVTVTVRHGAGLVSAKLQFARPQPQRAASGNVTLPLNGQPRAVRQRGRCEMIAKERAASCRPGATLAHPGGGPARVGASPACQLQQLWLCSAGVGTSWLNSAPAPRGRRAIQLIQSRNRAWRSAC
jgi:hypothetical protein